MSQEFIYVSRIVGGLGPNVWDKEVVCRASDIQEALDIVKGVCEQYPDGWITEIVQDDEIKKDDPAIIN